jgi:hypothetical protein
MRRKHEVTIVRLTSDIIIMMMCEISINPILPHLMSSELPTEDLFPKLGEEWKSKRLLCHNVSLLISCQNILH